MNGVLGVNDEYGKIEINRREECSIEAVKRYKWRNVRPGCPFRPKHYRYHGL